MTWMVRSPTDSSEPLQSLPSTTIRRAVRGEDQFHGEGYRRTVDDADRAVRNVGCSDRHPVRVAPPRRRTGGISNRPPCAVSTISGRGVAGDPGRSSRSSWLVTVAYIE